MEHPGERERFKSSQSLEDELGDDRVEILQADIGHKENVDSALSLALNKWGNIHAVFIGAGFGIGGNIGEKPMEHAGIWFK